MIGPLAHGQAFLTACDFGSAPTSPAARLLAADGSTVVARSTSGIVTLSTTIRGKLLTPPSADGWYLALWDDSNGTPIADEAVLVSTILTDILAGGGGGGGGSTLVVSQLGGGGATSPTSFLMKRGDTDPSLRVQLREPDPADSTGLTMRAWPVPSGATVKFTMRDSADFASETRTGFPAGAPKIHANATVDASDRSIVTYGWDGAGDTDTNGTFRGEIEVTAGSEIRSFPTGRTIDTNFLTILIVDDADPGINP